MRSQRFRRFRFRCRHVGDQLLIGRTFRSLRLLVIGERLECWHCWMVLVGEGFGQVDRCMDGGMFGLAGRSLHVVIGNAG